MGNEPYWPSVIPPKPTIVLQFHDGAGSQLYMDQRISIDGVIYIVKHINYVGGEVILNLWP